MNGRAPYSVYTLVMHLTQENTGQQDTGKASDAQGVDALKSSMEMSLVLTVECCQQMVKYRVHIGDMKQAQIYRRKILTHQVET